MASFFTRKLGACLLSFTGLSLSSGLFYKKYYMVKPDDITISNYSGHKKVQVKASNLYEPSSEAELSEIMHILHNNPNIKGRPTGSGLSHNGISFDSEGMVSMENMRSIIEIDIENKTVTAETGITVQELFEELSQQGFSLPNITSIASQQIGGWTQAGCHGTGLNLPPIDEFIERYKIFSPTYPNGLVLSKNDPDPKIREMFYAFRVGVGAVGVISNITFRIEEREICKETTSVISIPEIWRKHQDILKSNKIVKYLWIPYTNEVLVKLVNAVSKKESEDFLKNNERKKGVGDESVSTFNRRALLERGILNTDNIKETNKEEIKFLKTICGERIGHLEKLIVFNCESWKCVFEVAFKKEGLNDLEFMKELYEFFEKNNIPAHSPIEQRWTSSSRSWLSPAYSENPNDVYCWVGLLVMHLHRSNPEEANKGLEKFNEISAQLAPLLQKYNAFPHWAKIESVVHSEFFKKRLHERFPNIERFKILKKTMDPNRQFANDMINILFD